MTRHRICLCLPTNRACSATITAIHEEAVYAAHHLGADVHLLILDSADARTRAGHARVVAALPPDANTTTHHLDEETQRDLLRGMISRAALPEPDRILEFVLPAGVSYGSCTNRAFLLATALDCHSVHRRDSDSTYQLLGTETVFPIRHELPWLGRPAADASPAVTLTDLDPVHRHRPVSMAGASFIGELSVDIGEIRRLDEDLYRDVVGLWAPADWSPERKRQLAEESFTGAGMAPFTGDHSTLTVVDPMQVDMCNISFHRDVYERIPLPPATDTIGSDYFLIHLVHDAALPGILHNRHIENFYTPERRTDAGFLAYQTRFVKFLLSMLYFNHVYDRMAAQGARLLDGRQHLQADPVLEFLRESTRLDQSENVWRLDQVETTYRKLGGRYAVFAEQLAQQRAQLLEEARQDIENFARLVEAWPALVGAARYTALEQAGG
ncbi:DUF6271 family protein [Streptomyces sp. R08]|uniref:DUF6271 family protein n=1 Tax=Streptomyces sp. R08 TaxID=3238624 RepID=A0AB39MP79_9ACTN